MRLERIVENQELFDQILEVISKKPETAARIGTTRSARDLAEGLRGIKESWIEGRDPELEAIVREHGRPVLYIRDGKIEEPELPLWQQRLSGARSLIEAVIPSVGRVELQNHPSLPWVGTGWLVSDEVAVTNRHVAREFGIKGPAGFLFRQNPEKKVMKAYMDTLEEHDRGGEKTYRVREILHVEDDTNDRPDVAFLKVDRESEEASDPLPEPIKLASEDPSDGAVVGAVGYAAWDGNRNPGDAMGRIFENVYNVKRLHPGEVMRQRGESFTHDCSTLGGNSGSAVIDFDTGEAVGLHFAGSFLDQNYAVNANVVRELLKQKLNLEV